MEQKTFSDDGTCYTALVFCFYLHYLTRFPFCCYLHSNCDGKFTIEYLDIEKFAILINFRSATECVSTCIKYIWLLEINEDRWIDR